MTTAIMTTIFVAAALAWLFAAANYFIAVAHRKPELNVLRLLFFGHMILDSDNFTEAGQRFRRRCLTGLLAFFVCVVSLALFSVLQLGVTAAVASVSQR